MQRARDLLLFRTLWGWDGSWAAAINRAIADGFDGLETNLDHPCLRAVDPIEAAAALKEQKLPLIVELVTGGDYTPDLSWSPQHHLEQLQRQIPQALVLQPLRITLITGSDSWDDAVQDHFLASVLDLIEPLDVPVSLETHRSRSLFSPWRLPALLQRHPRLRLTADISHWCAVTERLITPDLSVIQEVAPHVDHIHARVGHAQGPSVSHPFAPEWAEALEAHRACWQLFLDRRDPNCSSAATMTPEFGPDGYMPLIPFSAEPLADVQELNAEMASWLRSSLRCSAPGS